MGATYHGLPRGAWRGRAAPTAHSSDGVAAANLSGPAHVDDDALSGPTLPPGSAWLTSSTGPAGGLRSKRFREHPLLQRALEGKERIGPDCRETAPVIAIQGSLSDLGYLDARPDGQWQPGTTLAVAELQERHELEPVGVIESATMETLDRLDARLNRAPSNLPRKAKSAGGGPPVSDRREEAGAFWSGGGGGDEQDDDDSHPGERPADAEDDQQST